MLRELSVQDFVIVRNVALPFTKGLTVLTGETGAGKSILVDALGLVLGARANAAVVRPGANRAQISAVFDITPALREWLQSQDLDQEEDTVILRRVIDAQGKSRAYVNGTPATLTLLRELGQMLVDIHGQHAHQRLLKAANQRDMLDGWAGLQNLATEVTHAWHEWQAAQEKLEQAQQDQAALEEKRTVIALELEELEALAPAEGEWEHVTEVQGRLSNGQALLEAAQFALQAIEDDQAGAQRVVDQLIGQLTPLLRHDSSLGDPLRALESASISLREARSDLSRYVDAIDLDPESLAQVDSRMRALFDAARKYRCEPTDLPQRLETARTRLGELEEAQDIDALLQKVQAREADYQKLAARLSDGRKKSAAKLQKQVTAMIRELGMPEGQFVIDVTTVAPESHGIDRITLEVAGHDQAPLAPMARVASGGELSRISLALAVLASQANAVPTLIFDEVDVGVSGAVAEKIGELLRQLGQTFQVLCVTHLPQVAGCAHHHFMVSKQKDAGGVHSSVEPLETLELRIDALAALLGGATITDTTREHAREMLTRFEDAG